MDGPALATAIAASQRRLGERLRELTDDALLAPSRLPEWSRLTVVCHLRYGAAAIERMVGSAQLGEPALFYPEGRAEQRPSTLVPAAGESPRDVVDSFVRNCEQLDATLAAMPATGWAAVNREPAGRTDIGPQTVYQLAVLRLTEVDVHAVDLDVGIERWSDAFCAVGLPLRVARLGARLATSAEGVPIAGRWLLRATDGPDYLVTSTPEGVATRIAVPSDTADGIVSASTRDLIALMLGRPLERPAEFSNDFARSFPIAFPGP